MQENYRIICTFDLQMIQDELINRLRMYLGHVPTAEQERAMQLFAEFFMVRTTQQDSKSQGKTMNLWKTLTSNEEKKLLKNMELSKIFPIFAA